MFVVRPIKLSDDGALYQLAELSGYGFTSLPMDKMRLMKKIEASVTAFQKKLSSPGSEYYLMVLEDTQTSTVVGCAGIVASVGLEDAFYHYRLTPEVHHSRHLGIHNQVEALHLCNDYTGASELCTLFLRESFRGKNYGALLSRSRFLLLASYPERFGKKVIAEMRGESDEQGNSTFYSWLQEGFLKIDFPQADYLCGIGDKSFIAELMPKYPIFKNLLPLKAQAVIGQVHEKTRPALKMLQSEGFSYKGYIDIFDGGPTIECDLQRISSVKQSQVLEVQIGNPSKESVLIISNVELNDFRATVSCAQVFKEDQKVVIPEVSARSLSVVSGDKVRIIK